MNNFRTIDRTAMQWDFLCNSHEPIAYEEEILAAGSKTFHITARSKSIPQYERELHAFFRKHAKEYDAIWVNVSSLANIDYLICAKRYGIRRRIIHSHNSRNMDSALRGKVHELNRRIIHRYATDFWACSESAAEWFYRDELMDQVVLVRNAIDLERLAYNGERREQIRDQYGLEGKFLIGNVGRLHHQKNQTFALKVFRKVLDQKDNAHLVLIGQGEDEEKLKEEARQLGIEDHVLFAGLSRDVPGWLSALDVFLFPSTFEGQPIAALEAEASGIPVLASLEGSPKAGLLDNFRLLSLQESPETWADELMKLPLERVDRTVITERFRQAGYEIHEEARRLAGLLQGTVMERYQIVEKAGQFNHAGSKATADVAAVAETLGFCPAVVRMNTLKDTKPAKAIRQVGYFGDWIGVTRKIPDGAVVLMQHPFHHVQLTREKSLRKLKEKKRVKFISFVHDVEKLRAFRYNDYYCQEFNTMMELADVLIVHNDVMKEYFVQCGFPEEKIVTLGIFDYLQEGEVPQRPEFEPSITIAGNLDTNKCVYIGQLGVLNGVQVQLYGPNFDELMRQYPNIHYHGSFGVDEIPSKLTRGFGLVWDGDSLDGCRGQSGQYLRYNNPHKLSLYLSSGLPVVIWTGAAEAGFVREHGVGLCVDSLNDLEEIFRNMTKEEYDALCDNVQRLSGKLRKGEYAEAAIKAAAAILE